MNMEKYLNATPEMSQAELNLLVSELGSAPSDGRIVEIGTASGGTLIYMLRSLGPGALGSVDVVDTFNYFPDHLGVFRRNLAGGGIDPDTLNVRVGTGKDECRKSRAAGDVFSFMLIDSSHKLKDVVEEMEWLSLLCVAGKAALHDYGKDDFPGVTIGVDRFLRRNPNYRIKSRADSLVVIEKTAPTRGNEVGLAELAFAFLYNIVLQNRRGFKRAVGKVLPFLK